MRRTYFKAMAAASAIALLAGCGGASDEGDSSSDGDGTTAAGGGEGGSSEPFTVGYVLPQSGDLAFLGPPQEAAVGLAIEDINAAGGVLGNDVPDAIAGDEAGQDTVAQASADRVISEGSSVLIGAAASGMSLAIVDKVTSSGVMQCSGSNTAPTFTDLDDNGLYIRTAPSDALQGPVLADTIVNDGYSNVAIIARADDYGSGLADATAKSLESAGATVALNETYDPKATDFSAAVESVTAAEPDAVVVIAFEEGTQIIQGLIEAGMGPDSVGMYGADGLRSADLGELVNSSDPAVIAGFKGTAPASADNPGFIERVQEFDPELEDNVQFAPQVYDCTVAMALAAEMAGSTDAEDFKGEINGVTKDGEKCSSYEECLAMVKEGTDIDYDGASGPLDFVDAGEPGEAEIEVYEFDDEGKLQSLETVTSTPVEGR